jgi:uncharacterized protein YjdB
MSKNAAPVSSRRLLVLCCALVIGCGVSDQSTGVGSNQGPGTGRTLVVDSVVVSPTSATLDSGQTVQLQAFVFGTPGVPQSVQFRSLGTIFTVSSTGLVTGLLPLSPGIALATGTVTVVSTFDTTKRATAAISVRGRVILTMQVVPNAVTLSIGQTAALKAVVTATPGTDTSVKWSSSNPQVATVSNAGVVTAVNSGSASILVRAVIDTNRFVTSAISVIGVKGVTVSPSNAIIPLGATLQAVATVLADPGVPRTVNWSSSNSAVATVSSSGVVTAVASGTTTIIARSTYDSSYFGAMAVLVLAPRLATVSIHSITTATTPPVPVNIQNIAGIIDITLNLDPGTERIGSAEALFGTVSLCSQSFPTPLAVAVNVTLRCDTRSLPEGSTTLTAAITLAQPAGVKRATTPVTVTINNIP